MPGEKGDIGDIVSDLCHLLPPTRMTSSFRLDGPTHVSPFYRAALETQVLLATAG